MLISMVKNGEQDVFEDHGKVADILRNERFQNTAEIVHHVSKVSTA